MKKPIVGLDKGLHTVVTLFEGNPMAAEMCAKNFHVHLLEYLRSQQTEHEKEVKEKFGQDMSNDKLSTILSRIFTDESEEMWRDALIHSINKLDEQVQTNMPGLDGCGGIAAILAALGV